MFSPFRSVMLSFLKNKCLINQSHWQMFNHVQSQTLGHSQSQTFRSVVFFTIDKGWTSSGAVSRRRRPPGETGIRSGSAEGSAESQVQRNLFRLVPVSKSHSQPGKSTNAGFFEDVVGSIVKMINVFFQSEHLQSDDFCHVSVTLN